MDELKPKINLRYCDTFKCENCEGIYFKEVIYLKRVSGILTGSSEDTTVPFPIYKCENCGHINKGFNPFEENEKQVIND
jgi:hypothetical protein